MEIKINIESGQMGETIGEIFTHLTKEEKNKIAFDVVSKWLKEPHDAERKAYEEKLVKQYLSGEINMSSWDKDRYKTEEQIRSWYEFSNKVKAHRTTREVMVDEIVNSTISYYKENILTLIKEDEQLKKVYEETKDQIVKDFPEFIKSALTQYFIGQMFSLTSALQQQNYLQNDFKSVKEKLNQLNTGMNF